jgi:predicted Zn-dependent protease
VCRSIAGRLAVRVGSNALSASYSQHDEAQADSEGVVNTLAAGIDPEGLPSFFEKLFEEQKREPSAVDAFFSTHPSDQSRVTAIECLARPYFSGRATRRAHASRPRSADPA